LKYIYCGYDNLYKEENNIDLKLLGMNVYDKEKSDCEFDYIKVIDEEDIENVLIIYIFQQI